MPDLGKTVGERWTKIIGLTLEINDAEFNERMSSLQAGLRFDALRVYLNAWTTTARLHAPLGRFIFGCPHLEDHDDIAHYVKECSSLADALHNIFVTPAVPLACLNLFGIAPADPERAAFAAVIFRTASAMRTVLSPLRVPVSLPSALP